MIKILFHFYFRFSIFIYAMISPSINDWLVFLFLFTEIIYMSLTMFQCHVHRLLHKLCVVNSVWFPNESVFLSYIAIASDFLLFSFFDFDGRDKTITSYFHVIFQPLASYYKITPLPQDYIKLFVGDGKNKIIPWSNTLVKHKNLYPFLEESQ